MFFRFKALLPLIPVTMLLSSCGDDVQTLMSQNVDLPPDSVALQWSDVRPILNIYCYACHSGAQSPDLSSEQSAKAHAGLIIREVSAGSMPPGGDMVEVQKQALLEWARQAGGR